MVSLDLSKEVAMPPVTRNRDGQLRHVGFELEYAGLSLPDSANLIVKLFGGIAQEESLNHFTVKTDSGKFDIKLDATAMQKLSKEAVQQRRENPDDAWLHDWAEKILSPVISTVMPNEIVTPPIVFDQLNKINALNDALREAGAKGTGASFAYAFGLHLNPEMPDVPSHRLKDYLAAFVIRQDWLKERTRMDFTRQITSFAGLFPTKYIRLILAPHYSPTIGELIDDYLAHNPTRNRALDMLPLFMDLDEQRVRAKIADERVHTRPAFHYRLPNCEIDNPDWSPLDEWTLWVEIEKLAEDTEGLRAEADRWLEAESADLFWSS